MLQNMMRGKVKKFRFKMLSEQEVRKKIRDLPNKKSMGIDYISYLMVKILVDYLAEPIMRIANATTIFHPRSTKIAVIKPLHKGEGKEYDDRCSYRSLSILPVVGRIVESLKAKQMQAYRETQEIIPEMHGYRSNMGTTTAILEMGEHVHNEVGKGNLVSVCSMNISAGFRTVPHIPAEKIGDDCELEWVDSNLSNRTQVVQVQASYSEY